MTHAGGLRSPLHWPLPLLLGLAVLIKLLLAHALPVLGDAYFMLWGRHPDYGYYDHPPLAGWLNGLLLPLSDHRLWLRLPAVLTEPVLAVALYAHLRGHDPLRARWLALLLAFSPFSLLHVMTTTDTGCILFSGLSFLAAWRAIDSGRYRWAAAAGIALGLAFLSKYFAVLLGLAYLLYFFALRRQAWRLGLVLVLAALPFGLLNLHWNAHHCWSNLLFNLLHRNDEAGSGLPWLSVLLYLLMMAYVVLPPILLALWRLRGADAGALRPGLQLAATVVGVALAGFLLASLRGVVGLHWVLWFYPMVLVLLWPLPAAGWPRLLRPVAGIGLLHALALAAVLALPVQAWSRLPELQRSLILARGMPQLLSAVAPYRGDWPLAAGGYTAASILAYHDRRPVAVLGSSSRYGRQDDLWTDFRALDGQNLLVFVDNPASAPAQAHWFERSRGLTVHYQGQAFGFLLGEGFRYPRYHRQMLRLQAERYYRFPDWLPVCGCPFTERYFPDGVPAQTPHP